MSEEVSEMVCPVCGYTCRTYSIGAVFCGPHGQGAAATPAVRMVERAALTARKRMAERGGADD
jgi:hypothetical protein